MLQHGFAVDLSLCWASGGSACSLLGDRNHLVWRHVLSVKENLSAVESA